MLRRFVEIFLSIPAPLAVAAVFLATAGETAFFLGLVLPGELAVILGGVLASQARVPLLAVLLAGVIGPITGDSIGYFLGRRYGRGFFSGRHRKRWAKARAWLARWEAFAVFLGRFTAFLRSIIPAAAGAARSPTAVFSRGMSPQVFCGGSARCFWATLRDATTKRWRTARDC